MKPAVLHVEDLTIHFGGIHALEAVSFFVKEQQIVGLIGPNGAGKTTVFNLLTGVYQPDRGDIYLENKSLLRKKTYQRCRMGVARTFQNIRLFKTQTVLDNVLIATHLHRTSNPFTATFRLNFREERRMRELALEMLSVVGLADVRDELATSLPYGKQRRLEIARALATKPQLLLLDEPAAGMNPQETDDLGQFIVEIKNQFDLTVFLIEHHMDLVMDISDRIYVIDFGKLIAHGLPQEVQDNPDVITAYLGVEDDEPA
jgi:branched-chain amino acid transport system ATP-binding protein